MEFAVFILLLLIALALASPFIGVLSFVVELLAVFAGLVARVVRADWLLCGERPPVIVVMIVTGRSRGSVMVMGSCNKYVTADGEQRWEVFFRDETHCQHHKRGFKTMKDARVYLTVQEVAVENGEYIDPKMSKITVGELGDQWIEGRRAIWKPSYLKSVETSWRVHVRPRWGDRPIGSIRHSEVQQWVSELARDRSATVVYRAFGILKDIYEMAIRGQTHHQNTHGAYDAARKTPRRHVFLTVEQLMALAEASGDHRALVLVLGFCGLRWGEATGLRVRRHRFRP